MQSGNINRVLLNQFTLEAEMASIDSEAIWGPAAVVVSRAGGEGLLDE